MNGQYHFLVKLLDLPFPVFSSLVFALDNQENPSLQMQRLLAWFTRNYVLHEAFPALRFSLFTGYNYKIAKPLTGEEFILIVQIAKHTSKILCFRLSRLFEAQTPKFFALDWESCERRKTGNSSFRKQFDCDSAFIDISPAEFFHLIWKEFGAQANILTK